MTLPACELLSRKDGKSLVDFGQNLVGWVRLRLASTSPGQEVTVRHAEVLENGELGTRPLRTAKATDKYFLKGASIEVLEPAFTFHGFRYAEVVGLPDLDVSQIEAVVIASDLDPDRMVRVIEPRTQQAARKRGMGYAGQFPGHPHGLPAARRTARGGRATSRYFRPRPVRCSTVLVSVSSWLADLAAEQGEDGNVPLVVPDVLPDGSPIAVWGDAACVVPWVLYERFGDAGILKAQWESMRGWVDCVASMRGDDFLWSGQFQLGDWLDPSAPPENPAAAKADPDVVATAYFARSAEILSRDSNGRR